MSRAPVNCARIVAGLLSDRPTSAAELARRAGYTARRVRAVLPTVGRCVVPACCGRRQPALWVARPDNANTCEQRRDTVRGPT